jgi:exodeoxyribonuclease V beta subunit
MTLVNAVTESRALEPLSFPLFGSSLIEASAGTGKTWTIAALYVRLVLGHDADLQTCHSFARARVPSEILVMTFTRAATRELSERIRERLVDAAKCFRQEKSIDPDDHFLAELMATYPEGPLRKQAAWRLAMAAEGMDQAAIHTIDAWCQRMLKEHAFDSGCLFDEELEPDETGLRVQATQDYWRQQCYPLNALQLSFVLGVWSDVDALISDVKNLLGKDIQGETRQETLATLTQSVITERAQLKADWLGRGPILKQWLQDRKDKWNGTRLQERNYSNWLEQLELWCQNPSDLKKPELKTGWTRLTPEGLQEARKNGTPEVELCAEFAELEQLEAHFDQLPETLRRHAAVWVGRRLETLKRQAGTFGFADMLHRLDTALQNEVSGERLRQRILTQYPTALIDEFQDTSPLQYRIFDKVYQPSLNDPHSALLLIGDPKQSIYGFRGADIYSYIQARSATEGRHFALHTNFRSTDSVVATVNQLFAPADENPQRSGGAFLFRTSAGNPLPFHRVKAKGRKEIFQASEAGEANTPVSAAKVPAMTIVHAVAEIQNAKQMREQFSELCAEQIVGWLNDSQACFKQPDHSVVALRPKDIAVLVRTGNEASAVKLALRRRGIASVYLSDKDSVFASDEARDLLRWLRAVAMPRNVRLVRAALATQTIGLSLDELGMLAINEEEFDRCSEQVRALQVVWQTQGVLAMLRQSLHAFNLPARWLLMLDGERRLTNVLHLAELLQTASTQLEGEQALVRWFHQQVSDYAQASDEQIVRLESDADLVQIITIHKSKGLEYPIVFLPFVTHFRPVDSSAKSFLDVPDETGSRTLRLTLSKEDVERADRERLKEDLRLLYVGLTRARHAVWVGFSAIKIGNSKDCQTHRSAIGNLLTGGQPLGATDWLNPLEAFAQSCDSSVNLKPALAPERIATTLLLSTVVETDLAPINVYRSTFDKRWAIGSFSRLTKDITHSKSQLSILNITGPADDEAGGVANDDALTEVEKTENEMTQDDMTQGAVVAQTVAVQSHATANSEATWHQFQKGPVAGNFLHDQLEWLAGEKFKLSENSELTARLQRRCERSGYTKAAQDLVQWLTAVVQTPLSGPNAALADLDRVFPEMEFWLPVQSIQTRTVDALCRQYLLEGVERPSLPDRELHGMLMGFADLVFQHEGRYWVLDYKSNYLGAGDNSYEHSALTRAMADHRYDMQAAIYMLALHRLLKRRLGHSYDPTTQLGGAVYFFLRGINGPERGVYLVPPSLPVLEGLEAMLNEQTV